MMRITPMVRNILSLNVVAFIAFNMMFGGGDQFALYDFQSPNFRPYQLITHMFLHANGMHLFSNMFSLFIFGPLLEARWGAQRFLTFYLITGLGASMLFTGIRAYEFAELRQDSEQYLSAPTPLNFLNYQEKHLQGRYEAAAEAFRKEPRNPGFIRGTMELVKEAYTEITTMSSMRGASGAVFGILMAFGMLFPNTELMLLFFPVPIKAKYFVMLYGAFELYAGIQRAPGDNVAHYAHLGGMLFAFILIKVWERNRTHFY
jgi:membrane associated rhomboid family serine protease